MIRIGSLCTGYGGLDLAAEAVTGGTTAWVCEYDPHPSTVLAQRFPGVPNLADLTTTDWRLVEPVDVLTAGYPCQPFSHAGNRKGTSDHRHLWPYIADAVRVLRPRLVLLENVAGHLSLGFGDVLGDLARLGYDARWGVVRASDAGAPHQRKRVFIAADAAGAERRGTQPDGMAPTPDGTAEPGERPGGDYAWGAYTAAIRRWETILGRPAPAPTEPGRNGPRLSPRFVEWMMGLPEGWVTDTGIPRNAQLKALGNGVVPQQAILAFRLLEAGRPPLRVWLGTRACGGLPCTLSRRYGG